MSGEEALLKLIKEKATSFVIIPDTSLDSLLAASILHKNLSEYGLNVKLSLDPKLLVDYPKDPAILLNLPAISDAQISIVRRDENTSLTGIIVSIVDKLPGIDKWDKLLALLAAFYHGLYDISSETIGTIETSYFKELSEEKIVHSTLGLRVWGAKRVGLATALSRTLLPFIPGISGNHENARRIVSEIFKSQDTNGIRLKEFAGNQKDPLREVLNLLVKHIQSNRQIPQQIAYKLLGDFYISIPELGETSEIEASELLGALVVYNSVYSNSPEDLLFISIEKSILNVAFTVYNEVIDSVAEKIARYFEVARNGDPIPAGELYPITRPDLIVDVLSYAGVLPLSRVVKIMVDGNTYTVLRELIRVKTKPSEAYSICEESQLCPVK